MLHQRLKESRIKSNLSQIGLAEILGISKRTIINYEKNEQEPIISTLEKIANICKVNLIWLATGKGFMENNQDRDNFIQSKIETFYELVAIINPNTLDDTTNNDLEAYKNDIVKIDLINVYDSDIDRLFAFIFLREKKIIYVESGRMNFSGGGSSLKTFGIWLINNKLMEATCLNFMDECHYKIFVENLSEKQKFMELPLYYNKIPNFEMSIFPTLFKNWKNGYFNDKPYQNIIQRIKTKTILKKKSE
ncbi:helix-turn-helix transcriptional regulator [Sulfurimonas sp.]|uniref:helix-turn-helix domain-containing protein n=1 Tax=Sulfurimonas sp. TaxID=2022749 RepID=UPI00263269F7|nr:helix-turn-helix transcriptional regulator [Sulfurimonas sp.]MDD3854149.1 helix-turn-helix transcriptional regulator [Sulfurimonas sp.]